jgi:hypothetical protein
MKNVDTSFDVRSDSSGKDPDRYSATLRAFHQRLWSKPLPTGVTFTLDTDTPGVYLHHRSQLGEFELSSDSIVHPFDYWVRTEQLIKQVPQSHLDDFNAIGSTIGGFLVFPSNAVDGAQTINRARGSNRQIDDRIDLTLESIRRFYLGAESPLQTALGRYADFFALFGDFEGYVDFFLLQDLVNYDGSVAFFLPFDDFSGPTLPSSVDEYERYRAAVTAFVRARNKRIDALTT